jgi:transposase
MRKIQEFVIKGQEVFIGLEDSKKTWKLCVRSNKMVVHETSMPARYDVLRAYLRNKYPDCRVKVVYEAGFRGFSLHDKLEGDGYDCTVTPPHTVTEEKCRRQKNDRIDSRRLAKNLENNDCGSCFIPGKELREDRQISRLYGQLQKDITRVSNRIRRALEFHDLDQYVKSGRWNRSDYRALKKQLDAMPLSESLRFSLNTLYDELEYLWSRQKETLRALYKLSKSERYQESVKLVKSAPGIGILTAIRLVLEWGDLSRFTRKEKFAGFLGLIPSERSSGENEHKGHITKQGNRAVQSWLIESAWVAIRHDPILLDKYLRVLRNSGSKKKAIVAVARKLALRIRTVVLTREPYRMGIAA